MQLRVFTEPQQGASYDDLLRIARVAEDCGYDAFFRSDHYLTMGGSGLPGPTDAWVTLAGLARDTTRVRLGTLVTAATFRLPGPLAIAVAQVDAMSGGRVELGLGSGWYDDEHTAYGIPFPSLRERFDRLTEQLEIVTGLWSTPPGQRFSHPGPTWPISDSPALPKPVQSPHPPVIVGGHGKTRTPALAARFAAEYNIPFPSSAAATARQFDRVRAACAGAGRDPASLLLSVALVLCCGRDEAEVARRAAAIGRAVDELREHGLAGTPGEIVERMGEFADAGAQRIYLQTLDLSDPAHLELVAAEVMPHVCENSLREFSFSSAGAATFVADDTEDSMTDDLFWPADDGDTRPIERHADAVAGEPAQPAAKPSPRRPWRTTAVAAGLAALVFGGVGVGVGAALENDGGGGATSGDGFTATTASTASVVNPRSYAGIAAKVLPSVVSINVRGGNTSDTGSGVVLRSDGYILTNNHVVAAAVGGGSVSVVFNDGKTASAHIVGTDAEDDLAVIKVARTGLVNAVLGHSSAVHVGDPVLAVGSPLGLTGTVTSGIVSALNRPVDTTSDQQNLDPFGQSNGVTTTVISAIQTDAAINPGNSGGPLVDASGAVIGINSAIASTGSLGQAGNIGVGFAIPIDQARVIAAELIDTGHASHPLMGVSLADATDNNGNDLARVQAVSADGPAAHAGMRVGDVITAVGDQRTDGADAVIAAIRTHQPGDEVAVTVERDGTSKTLTVKLIDASSLQG